MPCGRDFTGRYHPYMLAGLQCLLGCFLASIMRARHSHSIGRWQSPLAGEYSTSVGIATKYWRENAISGTLMRSDFLLL